MMFSLNFFFFHFCEQLTLANLWVLLLFSFFFFCKIIATSQINLCQAAFLGKSKSRLVIILYGLWWWTYMHGNNNCMGKHSAIVLWSTRLSEGLGLPVSHRAVGSSKPRKCLVLCESNLVCETVMRACWGWKVVALNLAFAWLTDCRCCFAEIDTVLVWGDC